jgi:hypothetical protein
LIIPLGDPPEIRSEAVILTDPIAEGNGLNRPNPSHQGSQPQEQRSRDAHQSRTSPQLEREAKKLINRLRRLPQMESNTISIKVYSDFICVNLRDLLMNILCPLYARLFKLRPLPPPDPVPVR